MIFFGILRIKLNFSFRLFHFSVFKACYFSWSKAIGGRKYPRVNFYFLMAFDCSETSETQIIIDIQKQLPVVCGPMPSTPKLA